MARLTVFAKGNSDLVESLFVCRGADGTVWNGLNEALRARGSTSRVRLRHETFTRSDALLAATGDVPPDLAAFPLAWPYEAASQFSAACFDGAADAVFLSIQPDVTSTLARHRASGQLFYPGAPGSWSAAARDWLRAACEPLPLLTPEDSFANLAGIVARLRQRSPAPIFVYNLSGVVPGESVDSHAGLGETLTTRIKRFNLMLIDLSAQTGITIVDVDRLAARHGADRLKLDSMRLNCEGCRLVAKDVLRLLEAHGCIDNPS